jgi:hypothetical protein
MKYFKGPPNNCNITLPLPTTTITYTNINHYASILETHLHSIDNQLNDIPSGSGSDSGSGSTSIEITLPFQSTQIIYVNTNSIKAILQTYIQSLDYQLTNIINSLTNISLGFCLGIAEVALI